jgi:hypothetical protein
MSLQIMQCSPTSDQVADVETGSRNCERRDGEERRS